MKNEKDNFSKGSKALYGKGELLGVKQDDSKKRITKSKKRMDLIK